MFPSGQEGEFKGMKPFLILFIRVFLYAPNIHPKNWFIHKNRRPGPFVKLSKSLSKTPGKKCTSGDKKRQTDQYHTAGYNKPGQTGVIFMEYPPMESLCN